MQQQLEAVNETVSVRVFVGARGGYVFPGPPANLCRALSHTFSSS